MKTDRIVLNKKKDKEIDEINVEDDDRKFCFFFVSRQIAHAKKKTISGWWECKKKYLKGEKERMDWKPKSYGRFQDSHKLHHHHNPYPHHRKRDICSRRCLKIYTRNNNWKPTRCQSNLDNFFFMSTNQRISESTFSLSGLSQDLFRHHGTLWRTVEASVGWPDTVGKLAARTGLTRRTCASRNVARTSPTNLFSGQRKSRNWRQDKII